MTLPYVAINKKQGSAIAGATTANKCLVIGPSSAGTQSTELYTFANTSQITTDIGYGNAQEVAQLVLAMAPAGYGSVDVLVAPASTAGSITAVSAASPTIVPSGTAYTSYDLRAEITVAGVTGSAKFKYSLDGGNTYTGDLQVPLAATYAIPNTGLTLTFGAGSNVVGNATTYSIVGPTMTTTDLATCITTLSTSNTNYTCIIIADDTRLPVAGAALFTAMDSHLTSLNNTYFKPTMAIVNAGGETKLFNRSTAALSVGTYKTNNVLANITSSAGTIGNFLGAVAEQVNTYLAVPEPGYARPRKPFSWLIGSETHAVGDDISLNIAQFPIRRCETPSYDEFQDGSVYHDERVMAPRTFRGESGVSVNQGILKYNPATASSYNLIAKGRVANRASEIARAAVRPFLNSRIDVKTDGTGRISEIDKLFIESTVQKQLEDALLNVTRGDGRPGHVSGVSFLINGENNIASTGVLQGTLSIVPLGYVTSITIDIYFNDVIVTGV